MRRMLASLLHGCCLGFGDRRLVSGSRLAFRSSASAVALRLLLHSFGAALFFSFPLLCSARFCASCFSFSSRSFTFLLSSFFCRRSFFSASSFAALAFALSLLLLFCAFTLFCSSRFFSRSMAMSVSAGVRFFLSPWRSGEAAAPRQRVAEEVCGRGGAGGGRSGYELARPVAEPADHSSASTGGWSVVVHPVHTHGQRRDQCGVHHNGQRHRAQAARRRGGELVAFVVSVHGWSGDAAVSAALARRKAHALTPAFAGHPWL